MLEAGDLGLLLVEQLLHRRRLRALVDARGGRRSPGRSFRLCARRRASAPSAAASSAVCGASFSIRSTASSTSSATWSAAPSGRPSASSVVSVAASAISEDGHQPRPAAGAWAAGCSSADSATVSSLAGVSTAGESSTGASAGVAVASASGAGASVAVASAVLSAGVAGTSSTAGSAGDAAASVGVSADSSVPSMLSAVNSGVVLRSRAPRTNNKTRVTARALRPDGCLPCPFGLFRLLPYRRHARALLDAPRRADASYHARTRGYNRPPVPELPDLAILADALDVSLAGRPLVGARVPQTLVLRGTTAELAALDGQTAAICCAARQVPVVPVRSRPDRVQPDADGETRARRRGSQAVATMGRGIHLWPRIG